MTIARIGPSRWELRTRHGVLVSIGSLCEVVRLWSRLRKDGWCDIAYVAGRAPDDGRIHCLAQRPQPRVHPRATRRVRDAPASR
jgi:hypothetical protein